MGTPRILFASIFMSMICAGHMAAGSAQAETVTLKVRTIDKESGKAVLAIIFAQTRSESKYMITRSSGIYEDPRFDCKNDVNMLLSAEPVYKFYTGDDTPLPCGSGEIVFSFSRSMLASDFEKFLKPELEGVSPATLKISEALSSAIESGDSAKTAAAATELAARLRQAGQGDLARSAEAIAYYSIGDSLRVSEPIFVDVRKNRVLLSEDSVKAITEFQKDNGIAMSGKADWKTLNAISSGYNSMMLKGLGS